MYLKLYDDSMQEVHREFVRFLQSVVDEFVKRGVEVVQADVCRLKEEFDQAVAMFEKNDVDCIVTLHLAYSPSLEAIEALCGTNRPILILDTTMDAGFGRDVDPSRIMYNHGIHGVMDLASMLRRRGRSFVIVAGHINESNVMERAASIVQAAVAVRCLKHTKALRVGESFKGMGDFAVKEKVLHKILGVTVEQIKPDDLAPEIKNVTQQEVEQEMTLDREHFTCNLPEDVHARSVRAGLGLRRILKAGDFSAFSMNFLAFNSREGLVDTVPFIEASKAMARGIGYAGEGDVLTAALVGAFARGFGKTTFTEIFCPDWKGNSLFLSHMAEINPDVSAERPRLVEKAFPFIRAENPAVITCAPGPGPAVFVNLVPGKDDTFALIVAPVEVLEDATTEGMRDAVRGWIRPRYGIAEFLEKYSLYGGTHHSALVLGERTEALKAFAEFAGLTCHVI